MYKLDADFILYFIIRIIMSLVFHIVRTPCTDSRRWAEYCKTGPKFSGDWGGYQDYKGVGLRCSNLRNGVFKLNFLKLP